MISLPQQLGLGHLRADIFNIVTDIDLLYYLKMDHRCLLNYLRNEWFYNIRRFGKFTSKVTLVSHLGGVDSRIYLRRVCFTGSRSCWKCSLI